MRHSNHTTRGIRRPARTGGVAAPIVALAGLVILVLMVGCGPAAVASSSPAPAATPAPTPDPHLKDPATADQIWAAIASAHMQLSATNATISDGTIAKRINADLEGWPLRLTAYTNATAMQKAKTWKTGVGPGAGDAPYTFAALNVIIEFGPMNRGSLPPAADPERQATAAKLVELLDPLLWPIEQHSVARIPARTAAPAAPSSAPAKSKAP